ncbi:hypothetical protein ABPG72_021778 [Tetrahymena utriculariae]
MKLQILAFVTIATILAICSIKLQGKHLQENILYDQFNTNDKCKKMQAQLSDQCKKTAPTSEFYPCLEKLLSKNHCDILVEYKQVIDQDKYCDTIKKGGEEKCKGSKDYQNCLVDYFNTVENDCISLVPVKQYTFDNDEYCNSLKTNIEEGCKKEDLPIKCLFDFLKMNDCVSEVPLTPKEN